VSYWSRVREIQADMERTQAERERIALEEAWTLIGIPRLHWDASMGKIPHDRSHREKIKRWHEAYWQSTREGRTPTGIYLHGRPGTGKSAIASGILKWGHRHRISCYFFDAVRVLDVSMNNPPVHDSSPEGTWDFVQRVDLLALDDLGRGLTDNSFGKLQLDKTEDLLRTRLARGKTTVITSNASLADLEKVRSALVSVIRESCFEVEVRGDNYRRFIDEDRGSL
jgi:DNA replication protein DnaC